VSRHENIHYPGTLITITGHSGQIDKYIVGNKNIFCTQMPGAPIKIPNALASLERNNTPVIIRKDHYGFVS
jgi:hypothetical protein